MGIYKLLQLYTSMPKRNRNKRNHPHSAVKPAPMLFRRKVTLSDVSELFVNNTSTLQNGFIIPGLSANGFRLAAADQPRVPQAAIWT